MEKLGISRVVLVEGKYDKIKLESLIDGLIIPTGGFRIYKDKQRIAMIRAVAEKQGAVIVTDSDRAGFQIRGFLHSIAGNADIVNVYIPQVPGKEKRKTTPGAERLLGVEGMDAALLRELFRKSGALEAPGAESNRPGGRRIEKLDFYEDGLTGGPQSVQRRDALLRHLGLPCYLTTNSLLDVINSLLTYEDYRAFLDGTGRESPKEPRVPPTGSEPGNHK